MVANRVERTVELPSPPEEVWTALADPESLADWFEAEVEIDVRRGGSGRFVWPDGSARRALVHEGEAGRLLAFSWWPDTGGVGRLAERTTVTISLDAVGTGTRVRVVEARPVSPFARAAA